MHTDELVLQSYPSHVEAAAVGAEKKEGRLGLNLRHLAGGI